MENIFKYNMVNRDMCSRCWEVELYRHLAWECKSAKKIWQEYNAYIVCIIQLVNVVNYYDDVFVIGDIGGVGKVKIKVIQKMNQIEHWINCSMEHIIIIFKE
jgi:hypothetical protein